jgi:hypothetical protein
MEMEEGDQLRRCEFPQEDFILWNSFKTLHGAQSIAFPASSWSKIANIPRDAALGVKRDYALLTDATADINAIKKQKVHPRLPKTICMPM